MARKIEVKAETREKMEEEIERRRNHAPEIGARLADVQYLTILDSNGNYCALLTFEGHGC